MQLSMNMRLKGENLEPNALRPVSSYLVVGPDHVNDMAELGQISFVLEKTDF